MSETPNNGEVKPQIMTLQAGDKFVLITIDETTKQLNVVAPNIQDPVEVSQILTAALAAVLQKVAEDEKEKACRIIKPNIAIPPFRPPRR